LKKKTKVEQSSKVQIEQLQSNFSKLQEEHKQQLATNEANFTEEIKKHKKRYIRIRRREEKNSKTTPKP